MAASPLRRRCTGRSISCASKAWCIAWKSLNAFVGCTRPDRAHVSQFLICTGCQAVAELDAPEVGSAVSQSAAKAGFVVDRMTIEMHGLCPACSKGAEGRRARHA